VKDDIVQLLSKIFSKIVNPFLSKSALSTSAEHLIEKKLPHISVINPYLQEPHLFNIIKGNCKLN